MTNLWIIVAETTSEKTGKAHFGAAGEKPI